MKSRLSALVLMLILFSFAGTLCASTSHAHQGKKIYVSKDQIFSNGKQTILKIKNNFFQVERIHKSIDGKRFFIFTGQTKKITGKWPGEQLMWYCGRCQRTFYCEEEYRRHRCPARR